MKLLLIPVLFLGAVIAEALPQGNPAEPQAIEGGLFLCKENFFAFKLGYLGDWMHRPHWITRDGVDSRVRIAHEQCQLATLALNLLQQFEAYGFLGSMKADLKHTPPFDRREREYGTSRHLVWGAGLRGIGFYWKKLVLGFDGKILSANLPIASIKVQGLPDQSGGTWEVRRWQVSAALGACYPVFYPYVGVRYGQMIDRLTGVQQKALLPADEFHIKKKRRLGMSAGVGIFPGRLISINVEGRFYDEVALDAALQFAF